MGEGEGENEADNSMTANTISNVCFEDWEAEQMQDPEFRAAVEELEPAYRAERLRVMRLAEARRGEGEDATTGL